MKQVAFTRIHIKIFGELNLLSYENRIQILYFMLKIICKCLLCNCLQILEMLGIKFFFFYYIVSRSNIKIW